STTTPRTTPTISTPSGATSRATSAWTSSPSTTRKARITRHGSPKSGVRSPESGTGDFGPRTSDPGLPANVRAEEAGDGDDGGARQADGGEEDQAEAVEAVPPPYAPDGEGDANEHGGDAHQLVPQDAVGQRSGDTPERVSEQPQDHGRHAGG